MDTSGSTMIVNANLFQLFTILILARLCCEIVIGIVKLWLKND